MQKALGPAVPVLIKRNPCNRRLLVAGDVFEGMCKRPFLQDF